MNTLSKNLQMYKAAIKGLPQNIQLALDEGAEINSMNNLAHDTALIMSAKYGHLDCVKLLWKGNADLHLTNYEGKNALMCAAERGHLNCVAFLFEKGVALNCVDKMDVNALMCAAERGHLNCVTFLLEKGVDLNCVNKFNANALHYAASSDCLDCVTFLLDKGADLNQKDTNGINVLIRAARGGHLDCVTFLFEKGVDLNYKDNDNWNALHHAAFWGRHDCVKFLLEKGVAIHEADEKGFNALMLASHSKDFESVSALLMAGANRLLCNKNGKTALEIAKEMCNDKICKLLETDETLTNKKLDSMSLAFKMANEFEGFHLGIEQSVDEFAKEAFQAIDTNKTTNVSSIASMRKNLDILTRKITAKSFDIISMLQVEYDTIKLKLDNPEKVQVEAHKEQKVVGMISKILADFQKEIHNIVRIVRKEFSIQMENSNIQKGWTVDFPKLQKELDAKFKIIRRNVQKQVSALMREADGAV